MEYRVRFSERDYMIDPPEEGDDRWKYQGSWGMDLTILGLYRSPIEGGDVQALREWDIVYGYDDVPVGQVAYMVVVEYSTGDTFGSHETWTVPAIKDSWEDAHAVTLQCYQPYNREGYRPWDGYFEHVKSITIQPFTVL